MPKRRKGSNKEQQQREDHARIFDERVSVIDREFNSLLAESDFVSKVIQIYHADAIRTFEYDRNHGSNLSIAEFKEEFHRQENFIRKYLPSRLYQITIILALEAYYASTGEPISKSRIAELVNFSFVERGRGEPSLKDGRNEIWDKFVLKWALAQVLPTFKVSGAINLASTARKINQLPKRGMVGRMKKALTGKHLQKLLQDHEIDWLKEKRHYQNRLAEEKRIQKTAE